jgi:hypothetical protein
MRAYVTPLIAIAIYLFVMFLFMSAVAARKKLGSKVHALRVPNYSHVRPFHHTLLCSTGDSAAES